VSAERLRVLHLGKYYPPVSGGMERVLQLLCEHERRVTDSEVLVVNTSLRTVRESWRGVPVTRVARLGAIGSVGVCPTFPWELHRRTADVHVIHEPNPLALVSDFVARQSGPVVVWYHSEVLRPAWKYRLMYRPFLKRVLDRAARIVVSSPRIAEHATELQAYRHKCAVIPFGVELSRFELTASIAARAREIRSRHRGCLVLFVGRLVPYKGVNVLIDALRDVEATAVVVGGGPLGPVLREHARVAGVSPRVQFAGEVEEQELLALYHACDMLVLPSVTHAEAFGMVQIEAMSCGKPVVSTDLPSGVPWVNQHGRTGLVVPPGDAAALASALQSLLADPARRSRMGDAGRARVQADFSIARLVEQTTSLYADVLTHAKGPIATAPVERAGV
jgi:glycosyltransferase involved in cell wall biosynthesis